MKYRTPSVDVWDLPVRAFHWGLVAAFATSILTAGVYGKLHQAAGYSVAALVGFRFVWGFVGTKHARFSSFVKSPFAVLAYIGRLLTGCSERHLGHNPAGGFMILALLLLCATLGVTGWLQLTPSFFGDERLRQFHRLVAYTTVALVPLHIVGVIVSSWVHRENLVKGMFTGKKPRDQNTNQSVEWRESLADRVRATNVFALIAILLAAGQWLWPQISAQLEINARRAKIVAQVETDGMLANLDWTAKVENDGPTMQKPTRPTVQNSKTRFPLPPQRVVAVSSAGQSSENDIGCQRSGVEGTGVTC